MSKKSKTSFEVNRFKWVRRLTYLLVILTLSAWAFTPIKTRIRQRQEIKNLTQQLTSEKQVEKDLRLEIEKLRGDNEYIELIARDKLGMLLPDEDGYVVIEKDNGNIAADENESKSDKREKRSLWSRFLSLFDQ